MVGPSARGSLNGTPTSSTSAISSATLSAASLARRSGYPAVRYGISAVRPPARRPAKAWVMPESDKVVADRETVPGGIGDLHDRSPVGAGFIPLGEARQAVRRRDG